jgi:hypothetical protein
MGTYPGRLKEDVMGRSFEIIGAFRDEERARRAAEDLTRRGMSRRHLRLVPALERFEGEGVRVADMRAEMQDEVNDGVAGPGVGMMTAEQARGALVGVVSGALVGILVGLFVGAVWGWTLASALSPVGRLLIATACFTVGGAVVGVVTGGGLKPRREAQRYPSQMPDESSLAGERDTLLEVHVNDQDEASLVQHVLEVAGAERVDAISGDGSPLPPQSDHPRPADPPGYWRNGESGHG